jgi:NTE family protein
MSSSSKTRNDYDSFALLKKLGQRAARRFLDTHYEDIGEHSSVEIKSEIFAGAR